MADKFFFLLPRHLTQISDSYIQLYPSNLQFTVLVHFKISMFKMSSGSIPLVYCLSYILFSFVSTNFYFRKEVMFCILHEKSRSTYTTNHPLIITDLTSIGFLILPTHIRPFLKCVQEHLVLAIRQHIFLSISP